MASELKDAATASQEQAAAAAADQGFAAYYRTVGVGRLLGILAASVGLLLLAQAYLRGAAPSWAFGDQKYLIGSMAIFLALFVLWSATSQTPWGLRRRIRSDAKNLRRTGRGLLTKHRARLSAAAAEEVEGGLSALESSLAGRATAPVLRDRLALDALLDRHLAFGRKGAAREVTESIGGAILIALLLRAFVVEPFHIPSGSMIPTLLVGDFIFVNKMAYGVRIPFTDPATTHKLGEGVPARGDVIVFINPSKGVDYVKRVVGIPGDRVELRDNVVFINGVEQSRQELGDFSYTERVEDVDGEEQVVARQFEETLQADPGHADATRDVRHLVLQRKDLYARDESFVIEPGKIFVLGDNRDNSQDSRYIGQIPLSYIKGRANLIWISFGGKHLIRFERMFKRVR